MSWCHLWKTMVRFVELWSLTQKSLRYKHHHLLNRHLYITNLVTYLQTVRIWRDSGDRNYACGHTLNDHSAEVRMKLKNSYSLLHFIHVIHILFAWHSSDDNFFFQVRAVTVHATNKYFVSASLDSTWCFYDLSSGLCLAKVPHLFHQRAN